MSHVTYITLLTFTLCWFTVHNEKIVDLSLCYFKIKNNNRFRRIKLLILPLHHKLVCVHVYVIN